MNPLDLNLQSPEYGLLAPQLIVFGMALILMALDAFLPKAKHFTVLTAVSLIGYAASMVSLYWQHETNESTFKGLFRSDGLTVFLSVVLLCAAILSVLTSASYIDRLEGRMPIGEFYVLLAFSVLGALLVASAGNIIMVFVGIELSSLATYILTAFARRRSTSLEGAMKYFLLGIFASAIMIYGLTWVYGITGSTDLDEIALYLQGVVQGSGRSQPEVLFALLLVVVGLGFKIAAVPFHMWTPDAYDGAPTPITGFMSVGPKAAGFAAIVRLLVQGLGPLRDDWYLLIAILATLTMVFGNLIALSQRNVKRMLAYSSIAHTGYMLVGVAAYKSSAGEGRFVSLVGDAAESDPGITSMLYYLLAYTFVNIGAFAIITWMQHRGRGMMLEDLAGLGSTRPLAALSMTIFMISLMGVPPLLGFYAKYYVIVAAINSDLLWLAVAIVLASALSAYFYLRVVAVMYFNPPERELRASSTPLLNLGIGIMVVANIALGLFSGQIIDLADHWSGAMQVAEAVASR